MSVGLRLQTLKKSWRLSWDIESFKSKLTTWFIALVLIFVTLPLYFEFIERRDGVVLNDWVLANIPAIDVSIPIMIFIWGCIFLFTYRVTARPANFLIFIIAYTLLTVARCTAIFLVPLAPPVNMIALTDPLTGVFYGGQAISKDLFYSGHTSLLFLIFLCSEKKADRYVTGISTFLVGILLLVQHIHYTTDVIFAPFFAYGAWVLGKKLAA